MHIEFKLIMTNTSNHSNDKHDYDVITNNVLGDMFHR